MSHSTRPQPESSSHSAAAPKPERHSAAEFIALMTDPDSFVSWDVPSDHSAASESYREALGAAQQKSGADEAVCTGMATIGGHPVAIICSEFQFLGGSIGQATAQRIIHAIQRATAQRLPLIAAPASGGTRMQEGTPAFALMTAITAAVFQHKEAHLPYLVYLRHPTTGGVLASWGSAGHITLAQPQALIGFLGPRVVELTTGQAMPPGVQQAENLVDYGLIDATVAPQELHGCLHKLLDILYAAVPAITAAAGFPGSRTDSGAPAEEAPTPDAVADADHAVRDAWEAICTTREADRPSTGELLAALDTNQVFRLSGSGEGRASQAIRLALVRLPSGPAVFVGQDRGQQPPLGESWLDAAALRCARRGISLANQLQIPLISVIDTPGAELSARAEISGLASSIGKTLHDLISVDVPTLTVLFGQGCGGGALAMLPADTVVATGASWLSPLPPEGASAILYHDVDHAPDLMRQQQVSADALFQAGLIDQIIPEGSGLCARTWQVIEQQLAHTHSSDITTIDHQAMRLARYMALATTTPSADSDAANGA